MFRRLVSNLPFSPALVGQLGLYAGRLRKEEVTRRLGLIFVVAALIVQSFAVFSPPEQASANSSSPLIPGGVSSVQQILNTYDASATGQNDFKNLMDYFGVTRSDLQNMDQKVVYICSSDHSVISFSREHHFSTAEGELTHQIPTINGYSTFYSVPLYRFDETNHQTNCYDSYVGHSAKVGWFAIMRKCGNFQVKPSANLTPRIHLTSSTCTSVQGFAYDERQEDQKVKVYLYFGGQPGKGQQYGPILASSGNISSPIGGGHGFSFSIPDKYQGTQPVSVWAVMQPLAGWTDPMVQSDNQVQIPGNCQNSKVPAASCDAIKANLISRNRFSFTTSANAVQGASIQAYAYSVTNVEGKTVYSKHYPSNSDSNTSDTLSFNDSGSYTIRASLETTVGTIQDSNCTKTFTISPIGACAYNQSIDEKNSSCKACAYDSTVSPTDNDCSPRIVLSKQVFNLSQNGSDANNTTANTEDRIQYDLHTTNVGSNTTSFPVQENIGDMLEYASIIDNGGGILNDTANTLSWGSVTLASGQTDTRSFVIQINDTIAVTPRAANDPAAYNCVITSSYGNTVNVSMPCPLGKTVENAVKELPILGITENVAFSILLLTLVAYLYARSRQTHREIRIIRKDFNV